jgi:hypothetical protein
LTNIVRRLEAYRENYCNKLAAKRRCARLAIATLDAGRKPNRRRDGVKTAANLSKNHPNRAGLK